MELTLSPSTSSSSPSSTMQDNSNLCIGNPETHAPLTTPLSKTTSIDLTNDTLPSDTIPFSGPQNVSIAQSPETVHSLVAQPTPITTVDSLPSVQPQSIATKPKHKHKRNKYDTTVSVSFSMNPTPAIASVVTTPMVPSMAHHSNIASLPSVQAIPIHSQPWPVHNARAYSIPHHSQHQTKTHTEIQSFQYPQPQKRRGRPVGSHKNNHKRPVVYGTLTSLLEPLDEPLSTTNVTTSIPHMSPKATMATTTTHSYASPMPTMTSNKKRQISTYTTATAVASTPPQNIYGLYPIFPASSSETPSSLATESFSPSSGYHSVPVHVEVNTTTNGHTYQTATPFNNNDSGNGHSESELYPMYAHSPINPSSRCCFCGCPQSSQPTDTSRLVNVLCALNCSIVVHDLCLIQNMAIRKSRDCQSCNQEIQYVSDGITATHIDSVFKKCQSVLGLTKWLPPKTHNKHTAWYEQEDTRTLAAATLPHKQLAVQSLMHLSNRKHHSNPVEKVNALWQAVNTIASPFLQSKPKPKTKPKHNTVDTAVLHQPQEEQRLFEPYQHQFTETEKLFSSNPVSTMSTTISPYAAATEDPMASLFPLTQALTNHSLFPSANTTPYEPQSTGDIDTASNLLSTQIDPKQLTEQNEILSLLSTATEATTPITPTPCPVSILKESTSSQISSRDVIEIDIDNEATSPVSVVSTPTKTSHATTTSVDNAPVVKKKRGRPRKVHFAPTEEEENAALHPKPPVEEAKKTPTSARSQPKRQSKQNRKPTQSNSNKNPKKTKQRKREDEHESDSETESLSEKDTDEETNEDKPQIKVARHSNKTDTSRKPSSQLLSKPNQRSFVATRAVKSILKSKPIAVANAETDLALTKTPSVEPTLTEKTEKKKENTDNTVVAIESEFSSSSSSSLSSSSALSSSQQATPNQTSAPFVSTASEEDQTILSFFLLSTVEIEQHAAGKECHLDFLDIKKRWIKWLGRNKTPTEFKRLSTDIKQRDILESIKKNLHLYPKIHNKVISYTNLWWK